MRCTRCGNKLVKNANGALVTGDSETGWILPSHLNNVCDGGALLHTVKPNPDN